MPSPATELDLRSCWSCIQAHYLSALLSNYLEMPVLVFFFPLFLGTDK